MHEPHARARDELIQELNVDPARGLDEAEIRQRRHRFGPNRLPTVRGRGVWRILVAQFRSLILGLLVAAMILAMATADWLEALAIAVVIVLNTGIGFAAELRAERSMDALRRLGTVMVTVRRDGRAHRLDAEHLVPGDIVLLEAGDVVAADLRLLESAQLQADESVLTGESVPVEKETGDLDAATPLADRSNMLFKGTAITRGTAMGVVVAIGLHTELGAIAQLVASSPGEERTPLERRLDALGRRLVWLTLGITAVVAVVGIAGDRETILVLKTAIALAVAAVPEGLPIVATLALARGMWRMARRNAVVNRLAAVETLGSTNVICTDKTGTLTENKLTVRQVVTAAGTVEISDGPLTGTGPARPDAGESAATGDRLVQALLETGVLCNNAHWSEPRPGAEPVAAGEPIEIALLVAATKIGIDAAALRSSHPRRSEMAFDPETRLMASVHEKDGRFLFAVKGAPEAVLPRCRDVLGPDGAAALDDADWRARAEALAGTGLRVLALARKERENPDESPAEALTMLGLVGMVDPPRADVAASIEACARAGIRVVIVTGDHAATAAYVARAVGLGVDSEPPAVDGRDLEQAGGSAAEQAQRMLEASVLARVSPAQKLALVRAYQEQGQVVAMTGDGVNDAPALRQADIGVAMGQRGTEVARQASDIILRDDAFSSIVHAVEQGRVIFTNIRSFVRYLVSCNLSEVMVVFAATLVNAPFPILPLQILFLNFVTDVFPALALGLGEGDRHVLTRPPCRARDPILDRRGWLGLGAYGALITTAVLGAFAIAHSGLGLEDGQAVTVSFLTLAFAQLWHVFNMRGPGTGLWRNEVTRNAYVWAALVACSAMLVATVYVPMLARVLETADPGRAGWLLALGLSTMPLLIGQAVLLSRGRRPS